MIEKVKVSVAFGDSEVDEKAMGNVKIVALAIGDLFAYNLELVSLGARPTKMMLEVRDQLHENLSLARDALLLDGFDFDMMPQDIEGETFIIPFRVYPIENRPTVN